MTYLQTLFLQILNLSIAASFLMLAVILLRPLLRKMPKWISCLLWGMVALRLLVPFSLESRWSLAPSWKLQMAVDDVAVKETAGDEAAENLVQKGAAAHKSGITIIDRTSASEETQGPEGWNQRNAPEGCVGNSMPGTAAEGQRIPEARSQEETGTMAKEPESVKKPDTAVKAMQEKKEAEDSEGGREKTSGFGPGLLRVAAMIWLTGFVTCLLFGTLSYLRLRRAVRLAKPRRTENLSAERSTGRSEGLSAGHGAGHGTGRSWTKLEIWTCEKEISPIVLGMIRPRVYLPEGLSGEERDYVLRHENSHVRRGDHLWKPLGSFLLSLYWFHPLCWISYLLFCIDVEMACDEKTTKDMNEDDRARYCETLLNLNREKRGSMIGTVAFGNNAAKSRIKAILNYRKPSVGIVLSGMMLCLALGMLFMTSPKVKADDLASNPAIGKEGLAENGELGNAQGEVRVQLKLAKLTGAVIAATTIRPSEFWGRLWDFESAFNASNEETKAKIILAQEAEEKKKVIDDVLSGKGPDLLLVSREDMEQLYASGVLYPIGECLSDETKDVIYSNLRDYGTINGEVVGLIPYILRVSTFVSRSDVLSAEENTLDYLMELRNERADVKRYFTYPSNKMDAYFELYALFGQDWLHSKFVDAENGISAFGQNGFQEILERLKQDLEVSAYGEEKVVSKEILAEYAMFCSPSSVLINLFDKMDGKGAFVGFPTQNGGQSYFITDGLLVVNKNSAHKEEIREFLEYVFSLPNQTSEKFFLSVRSDASEYAIRTMNEIKMKQESMRNLKSKPRYEWRYGDEETEKTRVYFQGADEMQEMHEAYDAFMKSLVPFEPSSAEAFRDVIWPEIEAYLYGDRDVKETVEIIDRRVQLYLEER